MAIVKRRSSAKIKLVPDQQVPHAILAITPEEHHDAAAFHNLEESEHQETSLYHKGASIN